MRRKIQRPFFFLVLFFFASTPLFATSNFYYDFENGSFEGWTVINKKRDYLWSVVQGDNNNHYFGSKVSDNFSYTEAQAGDFLWDNYELEFDLIRKSGGDINFFFRVRDERSIYDDGNEHIFNWPQGYGIHVSLGKVYLGKFFSDHYEQLTSGVNLPTWNSGIYHFKIVAYKNNFKIYENNNLLIDFVDTNINDAFLKGRIALGVGTGAVAPTEVYFDNIRVTPIREPVILVPGHGASISFKGMFLGQEDADDWRMVPGAHVYDNLIKALGENGYEEGKDLAVFYYNWLMPIDNSARKLCQLAAQMAGRSPTGKVNLVGHSMGGLVARTCAQKYDPQHLVKNLVTVGSPHQGVPESYGAWEGGEIWKGGFINKFAFELFLNIQKTLTGNKTRKETVREVAPSTKELMPVFDYLKNVDGQVIPFSATDYPQNEFLSEFPSWGDFSGQAKFVYGQGKDTLRWLTVDKDLSWKDKALGNWQYGKPINLGYEKDGDGTVSVISAYPEGALFPFTGFELAHREIVSKDIAVNQILKYLDIEATINAEPVPDAVDYLAFYLLSPAYLKIDLDTPHIPAENIFIGKEEEEEEEESGEPKLIIIANPPPNWQKEVIVKGTDNGEYVLGVGLARGEKISWQEYHGEIKLNEEDHFLFEFSDEINLQLKEIKDRKSQDPDQEMLNQLQTSFSSSSFLAEKLKRLEILMKISPVEALKYAYRIKNLVALEAKEKGTSLGDLNQMNKKLDQLIVYLEAAAENEEEIYSEGKAALAYQETKTLLEELEPLSPLSDNLFVVPAAQSLTLAEESLPVSLPKNWGELIRLGRGYFLGINSKILLN